MEDIIKFSRFTGVFSLSDRRRLKKIQFQYGIAAMSLDFFDMEDAESILISHEFWGVKKVKILVNKKYNGTLLKRDNRIMAKHLLNYLNHLNSEGKEALAEIISHLEAYTRK